MAFGQIFILLPRPYGHPIHKDGLRPICSYYYPGLRPPLLKEGEWCCGRLFRPLTVSSIFIVLYHPAQTLANSKCTIPFGLPHPTKITRIFVSHLLNEKARFFLAKRNLRPASADVTQKRGAPTDTPKVLRLTSHVCYSASFRQRTEKPQTLPFAYTMPALVSSLVK